MFRKIVFGMLILILLFAGVVACSSETDNAKPTDSASEEVSEPVVDESGEKIIVGLSFSDFATERWKTEEILMTNLLEEKGYVRHTTRGKAYVYEAVVRRENAVRGAVRNLLKRFFDGSAAALVQRLIEDEQLSPEEIEALQREAQHAERGSGS